MFHQRLQCWRAVTVSLAILISGIFSATDTSAENDTLKSVSLRFAAIGDMPYNKTEEMILNAVINPALDSENFPFILHIGDYKSQGLDCSPENDAFFKKWMADRNTPVFYTPGDNEWADCDDQTLNKPTSELKRLKAIRSEFFHSKVKAPQLLVKRQDEQVENQSWIISQNDSTTVFGSLHVIGSSNGRSGIYQDNPADVIKQVEKRNYYNDLWLDHIFKRAEESNASTVVIAQHGDPSHSTATNKPCGRNLDELNCDPHFSTNKLLAKKAALFGKPVLLIHGDTAPICLEKAFYNVPNLWRFNSTGDRILPDSAVINVSPSAKLPFKISTLVWGMIPGECKARS